MPLDCSAFVAEADSEDLRTMRRLAHMCSQTYYMATLTVRLGRLQGGQQRRTAAAAVCVAAAGRRMQLHWQARMRIAGTLQATQQHGAASQQQLGTAAAAQPPAVSRVPTAARRCRACCSRALPCRCCPACAAEQAAALARPAAGQHVALLRAAAV